MMRAKMNLNDDLDGVLLLSLNHVAHRSFCYRPSSAADVHAKV